MKKLFFRKCGVSSTSIASHVSVDFTKMSKLYKSVSNSTVGNLYEFGIKNGAVAGKLLGGWIRCFFYFYQNLFKKKKRLINSFKRNMHVDFKFEDLGTRIILDKKDYYDV